MKNRKDNYKGFQFKLRLFLDILATVIAWFSSYYLRFYILPGGARDSLFLFFVLSFLAIFSTVFFLFYHRLYETNVVSRWSNEVSSLLKVAIDVFLVFVVFYYYLFSIKISRIALLLFMFFLFILLFVGRRIANVIIGKKVRSGRFLQRTLLVGYGKKIDSFYSYVTHNKNESRFNLVGCYLSSAPIGNLPVIQAASLEDAVRENNIELVVLGFPPEDSTNKIDATRQGVELLTAEVYLLPDIPASYAGSSVKDFYSIPAIQLNSSDLSLGKRFVKRTMDILSCSFAVLLLSPLFLLLALLVKLSSPGPVLFRQKRVTRDGKVFNMLKFRSMRTDMPEQNGPHWTEENDPRITKIGRLLRKTSLDELPQFFNVLGGSMSLIGPRPERPELVEEFKKTIPGYDLRHKVKAGISGWAQVNGLRGNTSIEKRVEYDLYYIRNWSVIFDFRIVILTFFKGFINRNAY